MGWESFGVVRFDLGPLLQGQTKIAKLKSVHNSLIIGRTGLGWQTNLQEIMDRQPFYVVRFDLGPLLQGQTRIPISFIYKDIFTKFAGNVYGYENLFLQNFSLILKEKMAAIANCLKIIKVL